MSRFRTFILLASGLLGGCQTVAVEPAPPLAQTCRFLLTFDDGPSADRYFNTTLEILAQLESNDVQPDIKALFFVQTRNQTGGGTKLGQAIMRYQHAIGHVLGLHSGTDRGHIRHTKMMTEDLAQSLRDGQDDLRAITGHDTAFIRPTFWGYNDQTRYLYAAHDLKMLLTDVNNRDGIMLHSIFGLRERVRSELLRIRRAIERDELPQRHGSIPLVITLHDVNPVTALRMTEYLHILVEEARVAGLPLADKPFYDNANDIIEVASLRAIPPMPMPVIAQKDGTDSSTQFNRVPIVQLAKDTAIPTHTSPHPDLSTTALH
ncbi:MAG: polysaccharide deacetylase [Proteobacteria bacterium]|nr:polysaccharide deacetylase [Pseudomonadota bacterium]